MAPRGCGSRHPWRCTALSLRWTRQGALGHKRGCVCSDQGRPACGTPKPCDVGRTCARGCECHEPVRMKMLAPCPAPGWSSVKCVNCHQHRSVTLRAQPSDRRQHRSRSGCGVPVCPAPAQPRPQGGPVLHQCRQAARLAAGPRKGHLLWAPRQPAKLSATSGDAKATACRGEPRASGSEGPGPVSQPLPRRDAVALARGLRCSQQTQGTVTSLRRPAFHRVSQFSHTLNSSRLPWEVYETSVIIRT